MDKLQELAIAVEAMRKAQNEYFKFVSQQPTELRDQRWFDTKRDLLKSSKVKETTVDEMVKEILHTPSLF